jgi:hypothetical protein
MGTRWTGTRSQRVMLSLQGDSVVFDPSLLSPLLLFGLTQRLFLQVDGYHGPRHFRLLARFFQETDEGCRGILCESRFRVLPRIVFLSVSPLPWLTFISPPLLSLSRIPANLPRPPHRQTHRSQRWKVPQLSRPSGIRRTRSLPESV